MAVDSNTSAPVNTRPSIIEYFSRNSVAANLTMMLLLLGGLIAGGGLTSQVFPTIDPGIVTVTVPYPGATPSEVEESITRRVEESIFGIDGVQRVSSKASENVGVVTVELKDFVDPAKVRDDVEAAVERLADFPPEEAEQPEVERADTVTDVLTLVVASELDEHSLRRAAQRLESELLELPEVTLVSMVGARPYEISIEVREETLRQYELSIADVAAAVRNSSVNLSSGEIRTASGDLLLRTNNKGNRGEDFTNVVLRSDPDGRILRLGDVAQIRDGFADVDLIQQFNGRQSLFVKVQKSEAEDALTIAAAVKRRLETYQSGAQLDIAIWDDQTDILEQRLGLLIRNGILGFALVFLFLACQFLCIPVGVFGSYVLVFLFS